MKPCDVDVMKMELMVPLYCLLTVRCSSMSLLLLSFVCAFLFVEVVVLVLRFDEVVVVVPVLHERLRVLVDGGLFCFVLCSAALRSLPKNKKKLFVLLL